MSLGITESWNKGSWNAKTWNQESWDTGYGVTSLGILSPEMPTPVPASASLGKLGAIQIICDTLGGGSTACHVRFLPFTT